MERKIYIKNPLRFTAFVLTAFVAGMLSYKFLAMAYLTHINRTDGTVGGEIFIIPLMIFLFYLGWEAKSIFQLTKPQ